MISVETTSALNEVLLQCAIRAERRIAERAFVERCRQFARSKDISVSRETSNHRVSATNSYKENADEIGRIPSDA